MVHHSRRTLNRFPLSLLSAIIGTILTIYLTNLDYQMQLNYERLGQGIMVSSWGITLFLALKIFSENTGWTRRGEWLLQGVLLLLLATYYLSLPQHLKGADGYRFALISANLHLLVSIAPFVFQKGHSHAFWHYNVILFKRIFMALTYSLTSYAGLAVALGVSTQFFSIKLDE